MAKMDQAVGMANHQQATWCQHRMQALNQLGLGVNLKINQDIATEDQMQWLCQWIVLLKEVDPLQSHKFADPGFDLALALIGTRSPLKIPGQ